eukprot:superscaffoldBa00001867_g12313
MFDRHSTGRDVKVDLSTPFAGDRNQSFLSWVKQLEVTVNATMGSGSNCSGELVKILPNRLSKSAFLLSDSLPAAVKSDYCAVKERLRVVFGQIGLMDHFRTSLSACVNAPVESLEVNAVYVSRLVVEAFPDYGDITQRENSIPGNASLPGTMSSFEAMWSPYMASSQTNGILIRHMAIDNYPTAQRSRWVLELDLFDWVMVHKDDSRYKNANPLSRRPVSPDPIDLDVSLARMHTVASVGTPDCSLSPDRARMDQVS